ncbi:MAG: PhzF family phenazine biosynthesis protein [Pirellulales bacterium]
MKSTSIVVVDAFAARPFSGNPAAVCISSDDRDDAWRQAVAAEMNLAETAFVQPTADPLTFGLRWFTPALEVRLCGHATLASAHAIWEAGLVAFDKPIRFSTLSGTLTCSRLGDSWIEMDFPSTQPREVSIPDALAAALGCEVDRCFQTEFDYLVEVEEAAKVRALEPNMALLRALDVRGVIVTSRADREGLDFISRFFAPAAGVDEDPVTGSAHCALGPYWQVKLNKSEMTAYQASRRGGTVCLSVRDDRVLLRGQAVTVSRVEMLA